MTSSLKKSLYNYLFRFFFLYSVFNEHFAGFCNPMVEMMGFEPMTPCLQGRCSPSWATPPKGVVSSPYFALLRCFPLALSGAYARVLCAFALVGPSGLEPPTSCLSGTRSNLLSYDPLWLVCDSHTWFFQCREQIALLSHCVGIELSSHTVARKVFSPLQSLTSVFGMGTGGPSAFVTPTAVRFSLSVHICELWFRLRRTL